VGHAEAEGTFTTFAVVEGRVVRTPKAGAVSLTPLEGGSSTTVECSMPVCGFEATNGTGGMTVSDGGGGRVKALLGDLAFTLERPSAVAQGSRLLAVDAATGQRRWTSSTIQAPAGTRGEDDATGVRASPIALVGGKLVLAWSGPGVTDRILALHDPATGRLVSTGPRLPAFPHIFLTDAKGETAVASSTASDARSAAWDLAAGKVLWEQAADEKALEPFAVMNGVVYGHITKGGRSDQTIVVDLRTKKVLVPELAFNGSLTPTSTGHALVVRGETMYVFPAA
jgi:outer membrane protein assembly factor BamB